MSLQAWLDQEIAAAKARMRSPVYPDADTGHGYDLGWLAALEAVADRLLNEELSAGAVDEVRGNLRRFGMA